jgi:hypothetical protein
LSYKQQEEIKSNKMPTKRLRSFRDVTRHVGQKRDASKRKIKRRDLNRLRSNSTHSVSADVHHDADQNGSRSDDSLPQPVNSVSFIPLPD